MHPLVSRIHPSYRTALFAWFISRSLLWMTAMAAGVSPWVGGDIFRDFTVGTPGWSLLVHAAGLLGDAAPWAVAGLAEVLMLVAAISVYQFVRRDQLPQTAESATWLWAVSPAMAFTLPAGDWGFAVALATISLGALSAHRHIAAVMLLGGAIAFRPETVLLWPGVAFLGWKYYQPGKQHAMSPWATALGPPAAFMGVVLGALSLAGRFGVSLRSLQPEGQWRHDFAWHGIAAHSADLIGLSALVAGLALAIGCFRQVPRSWPILALPCLVWPLLYQPPSAAFAMLLFAPPFFGYLGRLAADPGVERPLLAASLGGLLLLMLF